VLLCDDITDPEDPEQAGEVGAAARSLASDGLSLLLATHDPALALHAHRVVILHDGRVQAMGAPTEMLQRVPWRDRRRWFAPFTSATGTFTRLAGAQA
jgi:ABC-type histidine transport system ATPase subunit